MPPLVIRDATPADAAACAAVYAPWVRDTCVSFEEQPPSAADMRARIERAQTTHAWIVAEEAGRVVGYAYGSPFKERSAYRFSCEVSVYLDVRERGRGLGRQLYAALLERMTDLGMRTACGGVTLPNDASEALHRSLGFEPVGVYRQIGWKLGAWRDVAWFQLPLGAGGDALPHAHV